MSVVRLSTQVQAEADEGQAAEREPVAAPAENIETPGEAVSPAADVPPLTAGETPAAPPAVEPVAEETPPAPVETVQQKADRLAKFRKGAALDEDALAAVAEEHEQLRAIQADITAAMEDPHARLAAWKALDAKGRANPDLKTAIANLEAQLAPPPAAKARMTEAEADQKFNTLLGEGKVKDALKFMQNYQHGEKIDAMETELRSLRQEKQVAAEHAHLAQLRSKVANEIKDIAQAMPHLLSVNSDGTANWKDVEVRDAVLRLSKTVSAEEPLKDIVDYALHKLNKKAPAVAKPNAAARPQVKSAPKPATNTGPAPRKGEFSLPIQVLN